MGLKPELFEFAVGGVRIRCDIGPGLSGMVKSFVVPPTGESQVKGEGVSVRARRAVATSPALRGLSWTCVFSQAKGFTAPGRIELWEGSSLVVGRLNGSSVEVSVGPESDLHFVGGVMLFAATALALRAHGLFHLHAACVDVPGLGTVLIVGESGSGKTTLALGMAALGGSLVSDDVVFLSRGEHDAAEVWGWPADMHLGPATLDVFPQLAKAAYRPVSDGRDKRAVPLSALIPPWLPCARHPSVVLFPCIGPVTVSNLTVLEPGETVARLIPQSGLALVPGAARAQEHLALLADIANGAVGLAATLGPDALPLGSTLMDQLRAAVGRPASSSHAGR